MSFSPMIGERIKCTCRLLQPLRMWRSMILSGRRRAESCKTYFCRWSRLWQWSICLRSTLACVLAFHIWPLFLPNERGLLGCVLLPSWSLSKPKDLLESPRCQVVWTAKNVRECLGWAALSRVGLLFSWQTGFGSKHLLTAGFWPPLRSMQSATIEAFDTIWHWSMEVTSQNIAKKPK